VTPPRSGRLVFALSGLAAAGVALVGALLVWQFQEAAVVAAAEREQLLLEARAHQFSDELEGLVRELDRLSRLADIDLADGTLEPEKAVLRVARRDSGLFSVAICLLDERGEVLWAEPREAQPRAPGGALVVMARQLGRAAIHVGDGEIDVAAPVAGRGALVAVLDGRGSRDLFGAALRRSLRARGAVALVLPGPRDGAVLIAEALAGEPPPPLKLAGPGQAWLEDGGGRRWLVTEAAVGSTGILMRLVLSGREVEGELAGPFRKLVGLVVAAFLLVVAGGLAMAVLVRRLERAELELSRAQNLAAMGKTAAAIAHEVKNALNGLSVGVDLLARGAGGAEALASVHRRTRTEIARLRDVADDLTLFAATPRLALAEVDLARLGREAAEAVTELAEDCGVTVRLDLPAGPVPLRGDGPKLLGVLVNLLRNAIEAMGPGAFGEGLDAPAPSGERVVELSLRQAGELAILQVADRGAGLAPEVRARLFEPFVTTKRTGTGLGLAIARRVVEAHGGRIQADDRHGGGTAFRLLLPAGGAT
jgi:two-component system C4-dicarboxylate transport sensor histidine kinase DctB